MLAFDVVNAVTIQGLETRSTDSFALLVLSTLALLLFSSGCPVVSCAVLRYLDRPDHEVEGQDHTNFAEVRR